MTMAGNFSPLVLVGDSERVEAEAVGAYLDNWAGKDGLRLATADAIKAILAGATRLAGRIARGSLPGDPGKLVGVNSDQDQQKCIDVGSHDLFVELLIAAGAASILSEEADLPVAGKADGLIAVAIDPLDGSGNVGLGAPLGTIFSIFPADVEEPFLQPGNRQLAAGYVSYGNSVDLGFSVGEGVIFATFDPVSGIFHITRRNVTLPERTSDLAFNASVYRHLSAGMKAYVDDAYNGKDGPRGRNFNMRWLGAAVGDMHRILQRGGLFFYVNDSRPGYEKGRLRLVYEANPIAFLAREAGGKATDGSRSILDIVPQTYHERSALVFGVAEEVDILGEYFAK
ncbi:class 1 fructose-bisphosphatase [Brucella intermedia]|uniref:Fructose-1,6-bisphosphatase class 1 n=6 Tax=Brucella TaxID=234 RepID=C4WLR6_9HYPH|nr:class 1 fructose-bisphosphatase [Brucella intermedia]PJT19418.1 class 1 fructose-bisphosphatase [Ochrobactrum sp. 30A/1000/2015]PJT39367.1 class 1 fructose-bisphosphatase [Ochrobactrum sp. 27A/999/2015]PJT43660.1 class 1 fructose-bisphosphatase [Ochrobactrum sp. 23A/997/2015]HCH73474.1 class 1 fructose-bisphosphatase [Ochrobactrum sp.]EEQ93048.1 Fructose-1,6-bisphosphatase [Brucella intermedia LMG 3301]